MNYRTLLGILSITTALCPLACNTTVIDQRPQSGTDPDINEHAPPPPPGAIAMFLSQFPSNPGDTGSTGTGGGPAPDTLYVMIGSQGRVCADPFAAVPCGDWQVTIGIPPELQHEGVISLGEPGVISTFSASGPNQGASDCWFGGGSFLDGSIEITSMDETSVVFNLSGTTTSDAPADGVYTAIRCP